MELVLEGFLLEGSQLGTVASCPMVNEFGDPLLLVNAVPLHEARIATATDVTNLGSLVAYSIEAHGLEACFGGSILTMEVGA